MQKLPFCGLAAVESLITKPTSIRKFSNLGLNLVKPLVRQRSFSAHASSPGLSEKADNFLTVESAKPPSGMKKQVTRRHTDQTLSMFVQNPAAIAQKSTFHKPQNRNFSTSPFEAAVASEQLFEVVEQAAQISAETAESMQVLEGLSPKTTAVLDEYLTSPADPSQMKANQLCVRELLTLKLTEESIDVNPETSKVLDVGAGNGQMGKILAECGFQHVTAQEGSEFKAEQCKTSGFYKDVHSFLLGKQGMPKELRRKFDVVMCSEGLGIGRLNASSIPEINKTLKEDGLAVLVIPKALMDKEDPFNCNFSQEINKLVDSGRWNKLREVEFSQYQGICESTASSKGQKNLLMIFQNQAN